MNRAQHAAWGMQQVAWKRLQHRLSHIVVGSARSVVVGVSVVVVVVVAYAAAVVVVA